MTFISQALYDSLKKDQANLLKQISDLTALSEGLTSKIKDDEAFLASYDSVTAKLEASLKNAEDQTPVLEKRIEDTTEIEEKSKKDLEEEKENLKEASERLETAIEKKEPQKTIDDLNAVVIISENKIKDLEKTIQNSKEQIESLNTQLVNNNNIAKNTKKQLADNAAIKKELDDGSLEDSKRRLADINGELQDTNDTYAVNVKENQATINAFETQDQRRNSLIRVVPNRKVFNRALPESEGSAIENEKTVLQEVVASDLDIANLTDPEQALLDKAIEDAKKKDFDPNFLSADQASDMARAANFSLLPVSQAIKEAAMKGLYSIFVNVLSDSNIYALERAGYIVTLTSNRLPEFEIRWDKINTKEEEA